MINMVSHENFSTIQMAIEKHCQLVEAIRKESTEEDYVMERHT